MTHERARVAGNVVVGAGAMVLVLTYLGVRGDPSIPSQVSRVILGGLGSLWLLALGGAVLIGVDLLDEWRQLDRIERAMGLEPAPMSSALRVPATAAVVVTIGGLVVVLAAWAGAAGSHSAGAAIRALNVGIAGLVAAALAMAVGVFGLARVVRLRQSRVLAPWILGALHARLTVRRDARTTTATAAAVVDADQVVMVGKPLRRYHAPGCRVLATGGPYKPVPLAKVPSTTPPCGLCLPEAVA